MKFIVLICELLATPAVAQSPSDDAQAAAVLLQQARTSLEAANTRSNRVAALTETVQAYEAGLGRAA